jgi:hypothetical protein
MVSVKQGVDDPVYLLRNTTCLVRRIGLISVGRP